MSWKPGDKAVCIERGNWGNDFINTDRPKYNEIVCVNNISEKHNAVYLHLVGYGGNEECKHPCYLSTCFRKVHDAETGAIREKSKKIVGFMPKPPWVHLDIT